MNRTVCLGIPAADASTKLLVAEAFASATFPLKVVVKNLMPHDVVFPEVPGLFLRHVASGGDDVEKQVVIRSLDLLQRLASSVEQVAVLNGHKRAMTITEVALSTPAPAPAEVAEAAVVALPAAATTPALVTEITVEFEAPAPAQAPEVAAPADPAAPAPATGKKSAKAT